MLGYRINHWADVRAEFRRPGPGQDLLALVVADNLHRGLRELRAVGPKLYLSPKHVAAMGGAEALLDTIEESLAKARSTEWPRTLRVSRALVEPRRTRIARGVVRFVGRVLGVTV